MSDFNFKKYLKEGTLLKEYDDAWVEKFLSKNGTKHVSYKSGKGVKMTDEDWAQHKGKYTINNGRIGYVKDDGSLHSVGLASSEGENDAIIKYMNDNYESDNSVPVVSENIAMSEFNYKKYLKNNPLLKESISKENREILIDLLKSMSDEELNDFLHQSRESGHELITKDRHDNPMADRLFTDFSSVTRWILTLDDDIAKDLIKAIIDGTNIKAIWVTPDEYKEKGLAAVKENTPDNQLADKILSDAMKALADDDYFDPDYPGGDIAANGSPYLQFQTEEQAEEAWHILIDHGLDGVLVGDMINLTKAMTPYLDEDKKPKERDGMVWADEIDKWVTKEEYIEYLETRADDHFSEPIKEVNRLELMYKDGDQYDKLERIRGAIQDDDYVLSALMKAMSTDDAHLYLDAIIRDHIDIIDDTENFEI